MYTSYMITYCRVKGVAEIYGCKIQKAPQKDNQIKHYCMDQEICINLITPHNFIKCE